MSWVENNRKINNGGGDDYSGLESFHLLESAPINFLD